MAVVPFPNIAPQAVAEEYRSNTAKFPATLTGAVKTVGRSGDHWAFRISYRNQNGQNAAIIKAALTSLRGMTNRALIPVFGYTRRGSGIGSELFSNGDFSDGTTGWSSNASGSLTAPDKKLRQTAIEGSTPSVFQSVTLTQYVPYAMRIILLDGRNTSALLLSPILDGGTVVAAAYSAARGLRSISLVADTSGAGNQFISAMQSGTTGMRAGDYWEHGLASFARCALVDDGLNALTRSDEFDHADWTKTRCTVTANSDIAPDGTTTADTLAEDGTAANDHFVSQGVTVAATADVDFSSCVFVKADNRTWAAVYMVEGASSHVARAWINLSTGALGTVNVTGANWADPRAFVVDAGNGWYLVSLVARKTNTDTSVTLRVYAAEGDFDNTFDGLTQDSILMWRACVAEGSGVPARPVQTVATADADGTAQTGSALYLKGLPASTDGILRSDDLAQVILPNLKTQLVRATSALNSDAAGLGYFQFEPPLRESPADNAPVIDVNPLALVMLDEDSVSFPKRPGDFSSVDFTLVEDIVPT